MKFRIKFQQSGGLYWNRPSLYFRWSSISSSRVWLPHFNFSRGWSELTSRTIRRKAVWFAKAPSHDKKKICKQNWVNSCFLTTNLHKYIGLLHKMQPFAKTSWQTPKVIALKPCNVLFAVFLILLMRKRYQSWWKNRWKQNLTHQEILPWST